MMEFLGRIPKIALVVTDFPEPDSPTMARVSPSNSLKSSAADGLDLSVIGTEGDSQIIYL